MFNLNKLFSYSLILVCCMFFQVVFSQQQLTTAQIQSIHSSQTAAQGDMYLDVEEDELYIGTSSGTLRKISNKQVQVDGQPLPEVSTPLIYLDTSTSSTNSTNYTTVKSFTLPGGILKQQNAIKIIFYKRRTSSNGSVQIRLVYGGQVFFTTGSLSNEVGRVEMTLFATGSENAQRAYIDDANTGNNGQKTGTTTVNSAQDQLVEIQLKTNNTASDFSLDFLSVQALLYD